MIIKQILFVFTCRKQKNTFLFSRAENYKLKIVRSYLHPHCSQYKPCNMSGTNRSPVLPTYPGRNTVEAIRSTLQAIVNALLSHRHNTLGTYTITL